MQESVVKLASVDVGRSSPHACSGYEHKCTWSKTVLATLDACCWVDGGEERKKLVWSPAEVAEKCSGSSNAPSSPELWGGKQVQGIHARIHNLEWCLHVLDLSL